MDTCDLHICSGMHALRCVHTCACEYAHTLVCVVVYMHRHVCMHVCATYIHPLVSTCHVPLHLALKVDQQA